MDSNYANYYETYMCCKECVCACVCVRVCISNFPWEVSEVRMNSQLYLVLYLLEYFNQLNERPVYTMTTRVENTYFCRFLTSHKILTVRHLVYFVPHPIPRENARGGTFLQDILDPHMVLHDCKKAITGLLPFGPCNL